GINPFFLRLQELIAGGAVQAVLGACHRPCQRLVPFDDFCQDVLLRAVEHQESFRGRTDAELLGWLKAIGRQRMATLLRQSRHKRLAPLPPQVPDLRAPSAAQEASAKEELLRDTEWLARVLAGLTTAERDLLLRRYQRNEKWSDIARDLGIAPNTLAQRHAR